MVFGVSELAGLHISAPRVRPGHTSHTPAHIAAGGS